MPTSFSRGRLGAAVVTAFACGLLFASGFDLTRFGFAQDQSKGGKVASSQVQSLAETGSAFEAIADHVTPSVVSIQTTRVDWTHALLSSIYQAGLTEATPEQLESPSQGAGG